MYYKQLLRLTDIEYSLDTMQELLLAQGMLTTVGEFLELAAPFCSCQVS